MDPILTTIDQALARSGLTDAAASKLAVGNPSLIKNMRLARGEEKRYSFQSLQELARVLGLDCYFGPKRELAGFSEGDAKSDLGRVEAIRGGYLPIPWHEAAKRKGSSPVALMQSWLASASLIPDFLKAIVPTSIQISLADSKNTVAVIDTSSPRKGSSGLWCYLDGASIGVCRAAFSADVTVLFPAEDDGEIRIIAKPQPPTFQILGKVVWLGLLMQS